MALTTIDDRGLKTPIDLLDNEKIRFGTGNDLELYHDGSNSFISDTGTGGLKILGSDIYIRNASDQDMIHATSGGAVKLYYNNVNKLNTESWGVTVQDDIKVIGAEGSHAQIRLIADEGDDNNDNWRLRAEDGGSIYLQNYADAAWETNLKGIGGGAIELYHNNALQCYTFDTGLKFNDDKQVRLGTDDDMRMFHDNTQGIINNATGILKVRSDELHLAKTDNEIYLKGVADGTVELYYDNSKKLDTYANGINIYGGINQTGFLDIDSDSSKLRLGDGQDLEIYHNGSKSYIKDTGTGSLRICSDDFRVYNAADDELQIQAVEDGAVGLYYNGAKKLETTNTGLKSESSSDLEIHLLKTGSQDTLIKNTGQTEICAATGGAGGQRIVFKIGANTGSLADIARFTPDGLCFGSDTAATNALDDYEEGSYTPTLGCVVNTYHKQYGLYTKIGNVVHVAIWIEVNSIGSNDGNDLTISLPFASKNNSEYRGGMAFTGSLFGSDSGWEGENRTHINYNTSNMEIGFAHKTDLNTGWAMIVNNNDTTNGTAFQISGTYLAQ